MPGGPWAAAVRPALLPLLLLGLAIAADQPPADPGDTLQPGDLVRIEVFDNPELVLTLRIATQGTANFPLVGELPPLVGSTTAAIAAWLRQRLEDGYLRTAQVTVTVQDFGPRCAYVIGGVGKPGTAELRPGNVATALQAIGQCGGFTDDANRRACVVVRERGGQREILHLNFSSEAGPSDVTLLPGDVVMVPRNDRIYVFGQVQKPGPVMLPAQEALTVSKAIGLAGGFERFARDNQVQVLRGEEAPRPVNVAGVLAGDRQAEDMKVRPGDIIFVPQSRF